MITVVTGGSGSGKSEYAERLVTESGLPLRYYVATMRVWDEEGGKRVKRHRAMRAEKGFVTVEQFTDLHRTELPGADKKPDKDVETEDSRTPKNSGRPEAGLRQEDACFSDTACKLIQTSGCIVLLECMSNLVMNEYYHLGDAAADVIIDGINSLQKKCDHLIIVTNEIFSDGTVYDRETMEYICLLGRVNSRIAALAGAVTEVVFGIPVKIR